jgi:hypothetical protein
MSVHQNLKFRICISNFKIKLKNKLKTKLMKNKINDIKKSPLISYNYIFKNG